MIDLYDIISNGYGNINITVTVNDLIAFAHQIAEDLKKESKTEPQQEEVMTRKEVMDYLGIKSTTLWQWKRMGILVPRTIGRKSLYAKSDILALQKGNGGESKV